MYRLVALCLVVLWLPWQAHAQDNDPPAASALRTVHTYSMWRVIRTPVSCAWPSSRTGFR
jgi:hypothetical protein